MLSGWEGYPSGDPKVPMRRLDQGGLKPWKQSECTQCKVTKQNYSVFPIGMAGCGKGVRRDQKEGQHNHRYRSENNLLP